MTVATLAILSFFSGCATPSPPPNILLVSMDTVRADHLSTYGYPRPTSPTLDRLAEQGAVFENAFSSANESAYSHGALFTGRHASELAHLDELTYAIPDTATLLSEILQVHGYQTAGFVAGGHLSSGFGFNQGWDQFHSQAGFQSFWDTAPRALAWLDGVSRDRPWMVFLHSYDAHRPYLKPGPFDHEHTGVSVPPLGERLADDPDLSERVHGKSLFKDMAPKLRRHLGSKELVFTTSSYSRLTRASKIFKGLPVLEEDVAHLQAHYDGCIAYADLQLGLFLAKADAAGHLANTLIVVFSDHGEDLLDHDFVNHRTGLFDSSIKVPFLLVGPGVPAGARPTGLVDALDLVPTVLAAVGAAPLAGSRERTLWGVLDGSAPGLDMVFAEGVMDMISARSTTHKLIYHHAPFVDSQYTAHLASAELHPDQFDLYDLRSDPGEERNLLIDPEPESLAMAASMRDALVQWRGGLRSSTHRRRLGQLDPAVVEQMQDKGYWKNDPENPDP